MLRAVRATVHSRDPKVRVWFADGDGREALSFPPTVVRTVAAQSLELLQSDAKVAPVATGLCLIEY